MKRQQLCDTNFYDCYSQNQCSLQRQNSFSWATIEEFDSESTDFSNSPHSEVSLDDFWFESVLGTGQNGPVFLISLKSNPNELFALKVLEK